MERKEEIVSHYNNQVAASTALGEPTVGAYANTDTIRRVVFHAHVPTIYADLGRMDCLQGLSEESSSYMKSNSNNLKLSAFQEEWKLVNSICTSIRKKLAEVSIPGSNYVEISQFESNFLPYLKEQEKRLQEVKEQIADKYVDEIKLFRENAERIANEICPDRTALVMKEVNWQTSRSCESFVKGFSLELETDFDIRNMSNEELRKYLDKCKKAYDNKLALDIVTATLKKLWDDVIYYLYLIRNGERLEGYSKNTASLLNLVDKTERENIKGTRSIATACNLIKEVRKCTYKEDADDCLFEALKYIYDTDLDLYDTKLDMPPKKPEWLKMEMF